MANKLIIVYKKEDEMILNKLKGLIETNDDDIENGKIIGVEDESVEIVAMEEKIWLDNKKAGNTGKWKTKVLFVGDVKGTDKLAPVIQFKFNEHGVKYGFSGDQALLYIDKKELHKKEEYDKFLNDLKKISQEEIASKEKKYELKNKKMWIKTGAAVLTFTFLSMLGGGALGGWLIKDAFDDAKLLREQMLLYGVIKLYYNDLDNFIKS